jgi:hypothetical protein
MRDHLIQGPDPKTEETRLLESMIKGILEEHDAGRKIAVSYNVDGQMMVQVGAASYNLTEILKHHANWGQLEFTPADIARFQAFLNDPTTKYKQNPVLDRPSVRNQFPNLQLAELNAIRNYTGPFYTAINHFLRSEGKQKFPDPNDPQAVGGEFKQALEKFTQGGGPVDLNQLMTEVLLNSAMASSALRKPVEDQRRLYTARSSNELEKNNKANLREIKGISIVLIGDGDEREFAIVAYGKIITTEPYPKISLAELLDPAISEGLELSPAQIQTLKDALKSPAAFQEIPLDNPSKARLFARMRNEVGAQYFNPKEKLFRVDRRNPFMESYAKRVTAGIDAQNMKASLEEFKSFLSTSAKVQSQFGGGSDYILHSENELGDLKNIEGLSEVTSEEERLAIPGQKALYTRHEENLPGDKNTHLHAEFVGGINLTEARAEEEEKILDAATVEIMAVFQSTEDKMDQLVAEAEEIINRATKEEVDLRDNFPIKSPEDKEEFRKRINAIDIAARLKISEIEEKIDTIASKGVAKVEQITADAQKEVSLSAKARQQIVTDDVTAKIVKDSHLKNYTCKMFKLTSRKSVENIKKLMKIRPGLGL